jgi:polysaccharide deacetylase family protein (PEP-CTERM system associated)
LIRHALTVDVEDWYHVENLRPAAPAARWPALEDRLLRGLEPLLELFRRHRVRATFFVLGAAAERTPDAVRRIAAADHEVACHGWSHELVYRQTAEAFRAETRRAKALLEELSGTRVDGYRASTFSITERSLWALDVLAEEGFRYDSSIAPLRHDRYGIPSAPAAPHLRQTAGGRPIAEFPVSFGSVLFKRVPIGGGFFRLLPARWTIRALAAWARRGVPGSLYLHPWEFDPAPPRVRGLGALRRFRHYVGLSRSLPKLERVLEATPFTTMADALRVAGVLS